MSKVVDLKIADISDLSEIARKYDECSTYHFRVREGFKEGYEFRDTEVDALHARITHLEKMIRALKK